MQSLLAGISHGTFEVAEGQHLLMSAALRHAHAACSQWPTSSECKVAYRPLPGRRSLANIICRCSWSNQARAILVRWSCRRKTCLKQCMSESCQLIFLLSLYAQQGLTGGLLQYSAGHIACRLHRLALWSSVRWDGGAGLSQLQVMHACICRCHAAQVHEHPGKAYPNP